MTFLSVIHTLLLVYSIWSSTPFRCCGDSVMFNEMELRQVPMSWLLWVIISLLCHTCVYNYYSFTAGRITAVTLQVFSLSLCLLDHTSPKWGLMIQITNVVYPCASLFWMCVVCGECLSPSLNILSLCCNPLLSCVTSMPPPGWTTGLSLFGLQAISGPSLTSLSSPLLPFSSQPCVVVSSITWCSHVPLSETFLLLGITLPAQLYQHCWRWRHLGLHQDGHRSFLLWVWVGSHITLCRLLFCRRGDAGHKPASLICILLNLFAEFLSLQYSNLIESQKYSPQMKSTLSGKLYSYESSWGRSSLQWATAWHKAS